LIIVVAFNSPNVGSEFHGIHLSSKYTRCYS